MAVFGNGMALVIAVSLSLALLGLRLAPASLCIDQIAHDIGVRGL